MPEGIVRSGDFREGTPITEPLVFGNNVTSPEPFGNVEPQANSSLNSNKVTWTTSPAHFGNGTGFSMQATPFTVIVMPGSAGTTTITITALQGSPDVALSAAGLPTGVTASFSPAATTTTSTMTLTVASSVPAGKYLITVTGTYGTEVENTNVMLVVP